MNPVEQVSAASITAGALIAQLGIIMIMFVGSLIMRRNEMDEHLYSGVRSYSTLAWWILGYALVSMLILVASDAFASLWAPVFGATPILLDRATATLLVILANSIFSSYLVAKTGGVRSSPFLSLLFLQPTLAVLLREPRGRIILYFVSVLCLFTVLMIRMNDEEDKSEWRLRMAYWVVSVCCLVLTGLVAIITLPE